MSDPISDLITRIKNAHAVGHVEVAMPYSKFRHAVLGVMKTNGYIQNIDVKNDKTNKTLVIAIAELSIRHIRRLSKPGQRIYVSKRQIPRPLRGMGLIILSTPFGVMSGNDAQKINTGGELICEVW